MEEEQNTGVVAVKELSYEDKVATASPIANPMAPKKLAKKLYKLIKKSK